MATARISASARKGAIGRELRKAANAAIADARRRGLSGNHAMVMEACVRAANTVAVRAAAGTRVLVDVMLQDDPLSPDGWSVSVVVTSEPAS